jgi:hypothetical protein
MPRYGAGLQTLHHFRRTTCLRASDDLRRDAMHTSKAAVAVANKLARIACPAMRAGVQTASLKCRDSGLPR